MTTREDLNRYSRAAARISNAARADLEAFFSGLDLSRPEWARDELIEFLPRLTYTYGEATATAAAEWFEELRTGAVGGTYSAILADPMDEARIVGEVRYAAGHLFTDNPQKTLALLSGATQKYVQYMGRATVARNAEHDPRKPRFARVPSGAKTCAWCTMLASRGWVYHSKELAGGHGHEFHDDCDCQIVPEWERAVHHISGYDPDAMYDKYLAARRDVEQAGESATEANIAAALRRRFPNDFTDGVHDDASVTG